MKIYVKNDELGVEEPTIFKITKERSIRAAKKIKEDSEKEFKSKKGELEKIKNKEKKTKKDENKIITLQKEINRLEKNINNMQNQDLGFKIFETTLIWEDYNFEVEEFNSQTKL